MCEVLGPFAFLLVLLYEQDMPVLAEEAYQLLENSQQVILEQAAMREAGEQSWDPVQLAWVVRLMAFGLRLL